MRRTANLLIFFTWASFAQPPSAGDRIPEFRLPDQSGAAQTFESIRGPKGAMLVFYRSADWCAYCKSQLVELEESRQELMQRGLGVAAISYDPVSVLKSFAGRRHITFPLLSDEDSSVIRSFGILNEEVPKSSEFYGIPHPVTFIVDEKGIVRSRTLEEDFRRRFTVGNLIGRRANVTGVPAKRVKITQSVSDTLVHGGQRFKLRLEIQLPPESHVYAPAVTGYIPIDWKLTPDPAFEEIPMRYPEPRSLYLKPIKETVPVYDGKLVLEREIVPAQKYAGEELKIQGSLRYQVCDDKKCYVPETAPLAWSVGYEPHDSTRAPVEIRRNRR
jgi:peroxiredoxin